MKIELIQGVVIGSAACKVGSEHNVSDEIGQDLLDRKIAKKAKKVKEVDSDSKTTKPSGNGAKPGGKSGSKTTKPAEKTDPPPEPEKKPEGEGNK